MEILVTVNQDGSSEIEVVGGNGKNCLKETEALEEALGKVENRNFKPEYRNSNTQNLNRIRQ
jgi:hypothetical protein